MVREVTLDDLMKHPHERRKALDCMPLLLKRNNILLMTPARETPLRIDDEVLMCGLSRAASWMLWLVANENALKYVISGEEGGGYVWKHWVRQYLGQ